VYAATPKTRHPADDARRRSAHGDDMTTTTTTTTTTTHPTELHGSTTTEEATTVTTTLTPSIDPTPAAPAVTVTQYSRRAIYAIWAAAAIPMAVLSWIVAPAIADGSGAASLARPLIASMAVGLVWQFVLVAGLVGYEQRSLRWSRVKEALWLRSPRSPKTGRTGGRTWLVLIPLIVGVALLSEVALSAPASRDLAELLQTDAGEAVFHGAWLWFGIFMTMAVFNTVLGEELLFRGLLLPRMHDAFGERDWVANGVLFGIYHLHMPWRIPGAVLEMFVIARPVKRYRSAWIGIIIHSVQTVVIGGMVLAIVI
jgi:membrane protease YdiL (CAAX protease family)